MADKKLKSKAIKIKGKDYVQVKDRVGYLSDNYEGKYSIETSYDYYPERKMWVVKATLKIGEAVYTGLAQELESTLASSVNHASALENCETSAVGRACAMAGIGILDSIASADEMRKAENASKKATDKQIKTIYETTARLMGMDNKEDMDAWLTKQFGGTPDQLSVKAAGAVITKLFDADKKQRAESMARSNEPLDEVITELPDEITLDTVAVY